MKSPADRTDSTCSRCGTPLSSDELEGRCPRCCIALLFSPSAVAPSPAQPSQAVRRIGDYELVEEIARGGMGIVFKARQISLNRIVAVKMIAAGHLASPTLVERFRAEAEAAARLDHPHIVPIYEVGQQDGHHYFSMRLIEGGSLAERIYRSRRREKVQPEKSEIRNPPVLRSSADHEPNSRTTAEGGKSEIESEPPHVGCYDMREAARLMATVSRAVHYAHQRGILHRDLKPGNILLDAQGEPHVTDFGLAKLLEADTDLTRTQVVLGTVGYMAPEQASGGVKQLTTAADLYSLGAILYELLTGQPPFRAGNTIEMMRQVVEKTPERPRALNPQVDRDLETICLKCLEKEPKHRYGSAEGFAEDLERWLEGEPIVARPSTRTERAIKWARREPVKAVLTVVSCIAVAALIGITQGQLAFRAEHKQRKKTEAALEEATHQRAEAEKQRRLAEELERLRTEDAEVRLELQRMDAWLIAEEEDYALAYLARVAERFPSNALVAERVLSELGTRQMPWVLFGPLNRFWVLSPDEKTLVVRDEATLTPWNSKNLSWALQCICARRRAAPLAEVHLPMFLQCGG